MSGSNLSANGVENRERPSSYRRLLAFLRGNSDHGDHDDHGDHKQPTAVEVPLSPQPQTQPAAEGARRGEAAAAISELATSPADAASPPATLNETQARLAETEARLLARTEQVERLEGELEATRQLLAEREMALHMQLNTSAEQRAAMEALRLTNEALDNELQATHVRMEGMAADQENLQAALTASIQHAAEQQDSLLRWQELAESADECVTGLEKQVTLLQQTLHDCNDQREVLHQELGETTHALDHARDQLHALNHHQETVQQLAEARERIRALETSVERDREQVTLYHSQLAQNQATLAQVEQRLEEQSAALAMARSDLGLKQGTIERSHQVFGRLAATLRLKDQQQKQLQERVSQLKNQASKERALWYKTLKRHEQQLAAAETELEKFWRGYQAQGERMATVQQQLVAREEELTAVQSQLAQQTQLVRQMRHAADQRIGELEAALERAEQQVSDLQTVLERRGKREQ